MSVKASWTWRIYWAATALCFAGAITMLFTYTPVEVTMGPIQKIFYLHMPSAINTFLAALVAFVGGVGFLWQRKMHWDDLSAAGARIAALMCTVVLVTGMIWGHTAWGRWWVWTPRLTFSLVLWILYVVYLAVRSSIGSAPTRAMVGAVYAVVAFLDVPLVWLSARLIPELHPASVTMSPRMKVTLGLWFVPVTLLTAGLIVATRNASRRRRIKARQRAEEASWPAGGEAGAGPGKPDPSRPAEVQSPAGGQ